MKQSLSLHNVSVHLGKQLILQDVSFHLNIGETLTVVGPSGSGKSTLLNILGGILRDYHGEISFNGKPINEVVKGYIPQNLGLLPWKSVEENIFLAKEINREIIITKDEADEIISELGIGDLLKRYPSEISGGQRQRVALARLFVSKPELLLMDEPFSALDTFTAEVSRDLLLSLWEKRKTTTIFTTHNLSEAVKLGQNILVMSALPGRVLHILKNPTFGNNSQQNSEEQYNFEKKLKALLNDERTNGNF